MEYIVGVSLNGLQLLATLWFFDGYFERRYHGSQFLRIAVMWLVLECIVLNLEASILSPIKVVIVPLIYLILNCVLYKGRFTFRVFVTVAIYALFSAFAYILEFAVMSALCLQREEFIYNKCLYVGTGLLSTFGMLLFSWFVKHSFTPSKVGYYNRTWALIATVFPASSILILLLLYTAISEQELQSSFAVLCLCVMAVANVLVFALINILKSSTQEHEILVAVSERERQQQESVAALSVAYEQQRKITHDFRKHLAVMEELLRRNAIGEAFTYVSNLQESQTERIFLVNTHNITIDAILNQKAYKAHHSRIDIRFEVNDLSGIRISPSDCTVVLGNLLDNAIEACEKMPVDKRWIQVSIIRVAVPDEKSGSVLISVLNPSMPTKIVNQEIVTTKKDASLHGFGLHNVKCILAKYGAEYIMMYEDGKFAFSLDWPDCPP